MLLSIVVVLSALVLFLIMPLLTIKRYYSPSQHNVGYNIFWILVSIITWPLVPIVMAMRRGDKFLLNIFWVSLVIFTISFGYLLYINLEQIIYLSGSRLA